MKLYTKQGDQGQTSLFINKQVPKHHVLIELCGTIDELNAHLGLVINYMMQTEKELQIEKEFYIPQVEEIQQILFQLGAHLVTPLEEASQKQQKMTRFDIEKTEQLEEWIDYYQAALPSLKNFILPGGHIIACHVQIARTVCRRAERVASKLLEENKISHEAFVFLNRLSDYLFILARHINYEENIIEPIVVQGKVKKF